MDGGFRASRRYGVYKKAHSKPLFSKLPTLYYSKHQSIDTAHFARRAQVAVHLVAKKALVEIIC